VSLFSKPFFRHLLIRAATAAPLFVLIGIVLSIIISPVEFIRIQRDRQRIDDLDNLGKLIKRVQAGSPWAVKAEELLVYISLPDDDSNCANWKKRGLPPLANPFSYRCSSRESYRTVNGAGWLPIDFTVLAAATNIQQLPIDPANGQQTEDIVTGQERILFYQYIKGSFSLGAFSERPPQLDEVYGAASKRKAVKAVLGVESTEIDIAGGGQMIVAGVADLVNQANIATISDVGKEVERQAAEDTLKKIEELTEELPSSLLEATADQVAVTILEELGLEIGEMSIEVQEEIEELKIQPAVEYIQQTEQRIEEEFAVLPEPIPLIPISTPVIPDFDPEPTEILKPLVIEEEQVVEEEPTSTRCSFNLFPNANDWDGDGLLNDKELAGNPATDPYDSDSDGDCLSDSEEINLYHSNPTSKDTDGDGYSDKYEATEYGIGLVEHPFFTNKQAQNRIELLSNSTLVDLLVANGYLIEDEALFSAPAILNSFYPDKDGDGVGDVWEIRLF